jgi:pimeloyl-[acyl-carrier protein] methyl ester esterase
MSLHEEVRGTGRTPLVCLHGWGLNLRVFDALAEDLADTREVRAIDLPGHGASDWDPAAADLGSQAAQIEAMLPPHCVLLGWSLGGQLALEIARRWPERLQQLVLVATTPRFVADEVWTAGMAPLVMQRFAEQLARDWHATVDEFLQLQVRGSRDATAALAELQRALREHGEARPEALAAGLDILRSADLREAARKITTQTLLISGQHDRITPASAADWLAQAMPQARHLQLPRAGHAPFLSHAPDFTAALAAFLDAA